MTIRTEQEIKEDWEYISLYSKFTETIEKALIAHESGASFSYLKDRVDLAVEYYNLAVKVEAAINEDRKR